VGVGVEDWRPVKVLLLAHKKLIPPPAPQPKRKILVARWRTEYDVREALKRLGHEVEVVGLDASLKPLMKTLQKGKPDIVFNLLEEFAGEALLDHSVVSFLKLMNLAYTGCNPRGLMLSRDKATAKKIIAYHGIATPAFFVVSRRQRAVQIPKGFRFPLMVKYLTEEASLGLDEENVVHSVRDLRAQVARMLERFEADLLVEEYVEGREIYLGALGNDLLEILPARELHFGRMPARAPRIASRKVKWSSSYRRRYGIYTRMVTNKEHALLKRLRQATQTVCKALRVNGYCRIDYRVDRRGQIYFIEANPNPQICKSEDFADAAAADGWEYDEMIERVLELGRDWDMNAPVSL
jgi:D-alanine-D-alanine ligase